MNKEQVRSEIFAMITRERDRQDAKWGVQVHPWTTWTTILAEEVGEVAQSSLNTEFGGNTLDDIQLLGDEAVQVAAVAVAMLEQVFASFPAADVVPPVEPQPEDRLVKVGGAVQVRYGMSKSREWDGRPIHLKVGFEHRTLCGNTVLIYHGATRWELLDSSMRKFDLFCPTCMQRAIRDHLVVVRDAVDVEGTQAGT